MFDKLEDILFRYDEVLKELSEPEVLNDASRYQKLMKEQSDLVPDCPLPGIAQGQIWSRLWKNTANIKRQKRGLKIVWRCSKRKLTRK